MSVTVLFGSYVTLSAKMWGRISRKWIILWCWLDISLNATRASCELTKIVNQYFKPSLTGENTLYSDKFRRVHVTARRTNDVRVTNLQCLSEATLTRHWTKSNSTGWKFVRSGVPFTLTVRKFRRLSFQSSVWTGQNIDRSRVNEMSGQVSQSSKPCAGPCEGNLAFVFKEIKVRQVIHLMSKDKQR